MKKLLLPLILVFSVAISCKKSSSSDPAPFVDKYMLFTANSTWNYETINNLTTVISPYTLTSTNRDTTINGRAYHVYTNSNGGPNEYYYYSGNEYYTYRPLGAGLGNTAAEILYLKDNIGVGTTWTQDIPIVFSGVPLTVKLTNTISEKGGNRVVKTNNYLNVIHVSTTMSVASLPAGALTTNIHSYYSPRYGLIENTSVINLNYLGVVQNNDNHTNLKSADLK